MRIMVSLLAMLAMGLGLMGWGSTLAWRQQRMLGTFVPVAGEVIDSRIVSTGLNRHRPAIRYAYQTQGRTWESDRLAPLNLSGSRAWAKQTAGAYPLGQAITAYIDLHAPGSSYLIPSPSVWPYLLILMGMGCLGLTFAALRGGGILMAPPRSQVQGTYGWYHLRAITQLDQQALGQILAASLWYAVGFLAAGHYLFVAHLKMEPAAWLILIYLAWGVLPLRRAVTGYRLARAFGAMSLSTTLEQAALNQPVIVRVALPIDQDIAVRELRLALVCRRITGFSTEPFFTQSTTLSGPAMLHVGQPIMAEASFEVPKTKRRPSDPFGRWALSRVAWSLELTITPSRGHGGIIRFPLSATLGQTNTTQKPETTTASLAIA